MSSKRVENLRELMVKMSIDSFLVTDPLNIYYLSGFTGDDGLLLVTENSQYLITDSRFEQQIKANHSDWKFCKTRNYLKTACELVEKEHLSAMAFEDTISYQDYDFIDENAVSDIVPVSAVIEKLRAIKDQNEINEIRESCKIAGKGYEFMLQNAHVSQSELELSNELDYFMKKNGTEEKSFETIVASGDRTTWPHGTATRKLLEDGDLLTVDFGYYYHHYTSDVTRTFSLGKQTQKVKDLYQIVLEAERRTIEAIKPGVSGRKLDEIGRGFIEEKGYGKYFNHGMGHGIGLNIHELPNVGSRFPDIMEAGHIVTIEPGIYVPGTAGIRIEDDVLVTETGFEILTNFPKDYCEI
ncbi:M24 family metallopeptidase [Liquorilactobacillus mali]|uniref:Xaa-Pro dipeptidase n=1 Tax=Liquorilactobacillus mali KCTC 3596 = DSM 20444 TaxID=1046596 RepID=J1F250_9LACO|nr:Xaa-Pro peptidase family protein [Liquorilactobacillus mali]EJE98690.1 Xaa-Pro dipeptidase [Liquorilactobacillus mali KCTC 3596 = DSM 20444]KRN10958.1 Xaa-Pro dipeptidase [Liquorilactobacillus mali KCTC 3596 = DSM 20444]QFQ74836.1 aminopeptidase P family protein [Liquorilactobacillus mali]